MIGVHMVYDLGSLGLFVFKKWAQKADVQCWLAYFVRK